MAHTIYTRYGLMLYSTYTVDKLVQYTILLSIKVPTICISLASPIKAFNTLVMQGLVHAPEPNICMSLHLCHDVFHAEIKHNWYD